MLVCRSVTFVGDITTDDVLSGGSADFVSLVVESFSSAGFVADDSSCMPEAPSCMVERSELVSLPMHEDMIKKTDIATIGKFFIFGSIRILMRVIISNFQINCM